MVEVVVRIIVVGNEYGAQEPPKIVTGHRELCYKTQLLEHVLQQPKKIDRVVLSAGRWEILAPNYFKNLETSPC